MLGFLNGYFDAQYARTHEPAPPIIYRVYLFLGLVAAWQVLSFFINFRLKRKFANRKGAAVSAGPGINEDTLPSGVAPKSVPQADYEKIVPTIVTEDTTKILNDLRRQ